MSLKAVLTADEHGELAEHFQELYSERDGQFELTGIQGVKTEADVKRLQTSLEKERGDHKSTKTKLGVWSDLDHEEVMGRLDRIPELEAAAGDKIDEAALDEMAEKRASTRLKPIERENLRLKEALQARDATISDFTLKDKNRTIGKALLAAGRKLEMQDPEDARVFGQGLFDITEDGDVLDADGNTPEQFLVDLQARKGHLWGPTEGGGASGGKGGKGFGANPFTFENWNETAQGQVIKEHGVERARAMIKSAGAGSLERLVKPQPKRK